MLSYQVREYYEFILNEITKFEKTIRLMLDYAETYQEITKNTLVVILSKSSLSESAGKYQYGNHDGKLIESFRLLNTKFKKEFNFLDAFERFGRFKQNIYTYESENAIKSNDVAKMIDQVTEIFKSYQEFLQSQDDKEKAVAFAQRLITFKAYFDSVNNFYKNSVEMLLSDIDDVGMQDEAKELLEIQLLQVSYTFDDFVILLKSISSIYIEIGSIVFKEPPPKLEIVKIESGSLLAKILGDKNIIEAIGLLLTKTIELFFNKFSKDGQMLRNSEVKKQLQEDINLCQQLQSMGFDITSSEENIVKAFELTTKETMRLASSTPKFKINGKVKEYSSINQQQYLMSINQKFLT